MSNAGVGVPELLRKVIRIRAEDSPNVKRQLMLRERGLPPDGEAVLPGVLAWDDYLYRRAAWDPIRQCIGLDGLFWEGPDNLLFPPAWLMRAEQVARGLIGAKRQAKGIGVDPGEGGAETVMVAADERGIIELKAKRTPDTNVIPGDLLAFMRQHAVPPDRVCVDRGGGGKQLADRLRAGGYNVRTVAFGEPPSLELRRGEHQLAARKDMVEEKYAYVNRRAQMYHELSLLLDPGNEEQGGFGIPAELTELHRQLAPMPKLTDAEGRYWMLPKNKKDPNSKIKTLTELVGCSPDQADALVLAVHALLHRPHKSTAGAA